MPCFVSLGGYPCSTNHVEINDVCVGLYNAELLVGPGRKCALRELSLTNKNNIIMTVLILWIIAAAAGGEYRKYLNDITYYLLSLTFTTLCEMGTLLCRSWIYVAEVFICFYRGRGSECAAEDVTSARHAERICQLFHVPFVWHYIRIENI